MAKLIMAMAEIPIKRVVIMAGGEEKLIPVELKEETILKTLLCFKISEDSHAYEAIDISGGVFAKDVPELASIVKGE